MPAQADASVPAAAPAEAVVEMSSVVAETEPVAAEPAAMPDFNLAQNAQEQVVPQTADNAAMPDFNLAQNAPEQAVPQTADNAAMPDFNLVQNAPEQAVPQTADNVAMPDFNLAQNAPEQAVPQTADNAQAGAADPFAQLFASPPDAAASPHTVMSEADVTAATSGAAQDPFAQLFGDTGGASAQDAGSPQGQPAQESGSSVDPMTLTQIDRNIASAATEPADPMTLSQIERNIAVLNGNTGGEAGPGADGVFSGQQTVPQQDLFNDPGAVAAAQSFPGQDAQQGVVPAVEDMNVPEQIPPAVAATNPPATLAGIPETTPPMNMQMPQQMGGMPGMMPPATNPPATLAGIPETTPPMNMQMPQQMGGMPG
ncbi:MAG: hypothetical protein PHW69_07280, partial [Elusimicrobiaceae bacterium]|nr:hypothetical protein [Elusimicrobiaceae bacterium]